jgi:N-acetylglutamate synthase-like GNAT family acetyltransferase
MDATAIAPVDIVPFRPEHAAGVVAVILPIQQVEFGIPITLGMQPDLQDIPAFYQHGHGNFWVALDSGVVVGTIALLDIGNRQAALHKMFVAATHRGAQRAVAHRLLDALVSGCSAQGLREIFLGTTDKFLAAHRFYEKNGFHPIDRGELPERFPVMAVDTRFYRRVVG